MGLSNWISSLFQTQRPTSSQLYLLNESQPPHNLQSPNPVQLTGTRLIGDRGLEEDFNEKVSNIGGRENILLVGEAGYNPNKDGGRGGILKELSFALFQLPEKFPTMENNEEKSKSEELNREVTLISNPANATYIREVLRDVKVRTRESETVLVGIVYSREELAAETRMDAQLQFGRLIGQIFRGQSWGVCSYCQSRADTILDVKKTITETLDSISRGQEQHRGDNTVDIETSFRDLVCHLGGKEQFLLVGNICPSGPPSERAAFFKEFTTALFGEDLKTLNHSGGGNEEMLTTEREDGPPMGCTQLPKPRPFPYPLILVAFRSTFLQDEVNRGKVKEILADVKIRTKRCFSQVIGVVCCLEELKEEEWLRCQFLLYTILRQTFSGPVGVCCFVRSKPESVIEVKRCVCDVIKQKN
ncbi:uncharacterized protein WCC33_006695 [Rhinophrynus dorsalis]